MPPSAHVCSRCTDNFIVNSKSIACQFCENNFHIHCVQIKDNVLKAIKECGNLLWYCDNCITLVKAGQALTKNIEKLEQQTDTWIKNSSDILKSLEKSKDVLECVPETKETWSNVVKRNNSQILLIKPKNASQDSSATKQSITQKIDPADLSIAVKNVKSAGQGAIVVECGDGESLEKLRNAAVNRLSAEYDVERPILANPKIIIVGITDKYVQTAETLMEILKRQYNIPTNCDSNLKVIKKYKPNNRKNHNVILEVTPQLFATIMKNKKIYIEWNSFPAYEYVGVLRCYKCWRYGHKAALCRQKENVCPLCNKNHKSSECNSEVLECTNCKHLSEALNVPNVAFNHSVFDKDCVCFKKAQEISKSKTRYI